MAESPLAGTKYMNITGMILVVLGILSIMAPAVAGSTLVIFIGAMLLLAGITEIIQGIQHKVKDRWLTLILGIIAVISGALLIAQPLLGLGVFTLMLVGYFIADGVWKFYSAFQLRHFTNWGWILVSGLLSLLLGYLIWSNWPLSGVWAIGVLVGVNLLMTGIMMMMIAANIKSANA